MGFFEALEVNFLSFRKKGKTNAASYAGTYSEILELQGLLNNEQEKRTPLGDTTSRRTVSKRVESEEIQEAIKKFNALTTTEKDNILELADRRLQEKILQFMNTNATIMNTTDTLQCSFRNVLNDIQELEKSKNIKKDEAMKLADKYDSIRKICMGNVDNTIKAFEEFKGEQDAENSSVSLSDSAEYVITQSNNFRQTVLSYSSLLDSKFLEFSKVKDETRKNQLIQEIKNTISKVQNEYNKYYENVSDKLNSFIPQVTQAKNQFNAIMRKYVTNGVPQDFCFENKECENTFIDAMLDTLNYTGAKIF